MFKGKLNLETGFNKLYVICHNDPKKNRCDNCMGCIDPHCNRSNCDAHGNCQCQRTQCLCLGRI